MALFKPRGVWVLGGWELPQYSYLSPAKLGLGLSLAKTGIFFGEHPVASYDAKKSHDFLLVATYFKTLWETNMVLK